MTWRQRRRVLFVSALAYAAGSAALHPVVNSLYTSHFLHAHTHARAVACEGSRVNTTTQTSNTTASSSAAAGTRTRTTTCVYLPWSTLATLVVAVVLYAAWQLYAATRSSSSSRERVATKNDDADASSSSNGSHRRRRRSNSVSVSRTTVAAAACARCRGWPVLWWAVCFVFLWPPLTSAPPPPFVTTALYGLRLALFVDASARMRAHVLGHGCRNASTRLGSTHTASPTTTTTTTSARGEDSDVGNGSSALQLSPLMQWLLLLMRALVGGSVVCVATWLRERRPPPSTSPSSRTAHADAFAVLTIACAVAATLAMLLCCRLRDGVVVLCSSSNDDNNDGDNTSTTLRAWCGFVLQTLRRPCMRAVLPLWALQAYSDVYTSAFYALLFRMTCSARVRVRGDDIGNVGTVAAAAASNCDGSDTMTLAMLSVYAVLLTSSVLLPCVLAPTLPPLLHTLLGSTRRRVAALLALRCIAVAVACAAVAIVAARASPLSLSSCHAQQQRQHGVCVAVAALLVVDVVLVAALRVAQEAVSSDVVDEDVVVYARRSTRHAAAQLHRLRRAVARACQCVALLVGCSVVLLYMDDAPAHATATTTVVCIVAMQAVLTTALTLLAWLRYYNLDDAHLRFVQLAMHKRGEAVSIKVI